MVPVALADGSFQGTAAHDAQAVRPFLDRGAQATQLGRHGGNSVTLLKESDRIATMATELRRLGAAVEERPDGLRIVGGRPLKGAVCQSHGDHRVAMAMMVAGLVAQGEMRVEDTACVATSFPGFDKRLRGLLTPSGQG